MQLWLSLLCNVDDYIMLMRNGAYYFILNICAVDPTIVFPSATFFVVSNIVGQFRLITQFARFVVSASDELHKTPRRAVTP